MKCRAADLFCGAGGTSTGLAQAARAAGVDVDLVAVNHWDVAVATHQANHPWARHVCADLASLDPSKLVPGGALDLLVASPECTHHSHARAGKPCSDQSRASGWHVTHWCERLRVRDVLVENVREFLDWGPLLSRPLVWRGKTVPAGRPDPRRKGDTFRAWVSALESLGYRVEWRVLCSADYGEATERRRLFVRASRRGAIRWPAKTHEGRWRAVREVIDWSIPSQDIRDRARPLTPRTLQRIEAGLKRFGGEAFLVVLRGTNPAQCGSWARSLDEPLPTVTAGGGHYGVCEPFVIPMEHRGAGKVRPVSTPLPTITTAKGGAFGLCEPFIVQYQGGTDRQALRVHSVDKPLPTQPTENRFGLCEPFVVKYYGRGGVTSVDEPLGTITTKDRFGLVEPYRLGLRFRMFQPHELAGAMGFDGYTFAGNKTEQTKQIGNAVSVRQARALCAEILRGARR